MPKHKLNSSFELLHQQFSTLNWTLYDIPFVNTNEKMYHWPGNKQEDIMICVHKGNGISEPFHRQDFFFLNYAYKDNYDALSYKYNNRITINEGECYIGQPYAGYALDGKYDKEIIIIGILIKKETFFKAFLTALSSNSTLFNFFLSPQINEFSDEYIHIKFDDVAPIRSLLNMMVVEYANKQEDTQDLLKSLVLTLFMHIARQYSISYTQTKSEKLSDKIVQYIGEHFDTVTLKSLANHFSYHANYISTLLTKEIGKSFSQILLEQRMNRAISLIKATSLSNEKIAYMLGYSNSSNFYKAFREYFGCSPREYK